MRLTIKTIHLSLLAVISIVSLHAAGCQSTNQADAEIVARTTPPTPTTATTSTAPSASTINVERLLEGNRRFVAGESIHPDADRTKLAELVTAQNPFAVILSCSDSRVPPELVFDQGFGDLFVVRVAGNIFDDAVDGSIEYAIEHLGAELVVVMGHESCGAVTAALEHSREAHIKTLAEAIEPAIKNVGGTGQSQVDEAVRANVRLVVEEIKRNEPILKQRVTENKVQVVGAYYDLESGAVSLVPENGF